MPFSQLTMALNAWLHGIQAHSARVNYVVDGNLMQDINAYSIYDVEEITLVQNALVQLNGALNGQQLVLIKTRKQGDGNGGLRIAGASHLVKDDYYTLSSKSNTGFYHQYQVSGWKRHQHWQWGASANVFRDIHPARYKSSPAEQDIRPAQVNRYRFNAWADFSFSANHSLFLRLNYVPNRVGSQYRYGGNESLTDRRQAPFNPTLSLRNYFGGGWSHQLDASLLVDRYTSEMNSYTGSLNEYHNYDTRLKNSMLLLRDRISYHLNSGNWQWEPAVNVSYRKYKAELDNREYTLRDDQLISELRTTAQQQSESLVLTPQMGITFKQHVHLLAGLSSRLSDDRQAHFDSARIFPFISFAADILRLRKETSNYSGKFFFSWSRPGDLSDEIYKMDDYLTEPPYRSTNSLLYLQIPYEEKVRFSSLQTGVQFSSGDRYSISYNFEHRKYHDELLVSVPFPTSQLVTWPPHTYTAHRLGITAMVYKSATVEWRVV